MHYLSAALMALALTTVVHCGLHGATSEGVPAIQEILASKDTTEIKMTRVDECILSLKKQGKINQAFIVDLTENIGAWSVYDSLKKNAAEPYEAALTALLNDQKILREDKVGYSLRLSQVTQSCKNDAVFSQLVEKYDDVKHLQYMVELGHAFVKSKTGVVMRLAVAWSQSYRATIGTSGDFYQAMNSLNELLGEFNTVEANKALLDNLRELTMPEPRVTAFGILAKVKYHPALDLAKQTADDVTEELYVRIAAAACLAEIGEATEVDAVTSSGNSVLSAYSEAAKADGTTEGIDQLAAALKQQLAGLK